MFAKFRTKTYPLLCTCAKFCAFSVKFRSGLYAANESVRIMPQAEVKSLALCICSLAVSKLNKQNYASLPSLTENTKQALKGQDFWDLSERKCLLLSKILCLEVTEAKKLIKRYPALARRKETCISETFDYLCKQGLKLAEIQEMPWLLLYNPKSLRLRCLQVKSFMNISNLKDCFPFVKLSLSKLQEIALQWSNEMEMFKRANDGSMSQFNRIDFLKNALEVDENEILDMMKKVPPIIHLPFEKLKWTVEFLINNGVNPKDVKKDCWIFLHNSDMMSARMEQCKNDNLSVIKPWMLRCSEKKYNSYAQRKVKDQFRHVPENLQKLLEIMLGCTTGQAQSILRSYVGIRSSSETQLSSKITLLKNHHFSNTEIIHHAKVLALSGTRKNYPTTIKESKKLIQTSYENQFITLVKKPGWYFLRTNRELLFRRVFDGSALQLLFT